MDRDLDALFNTRPAADGRDDEFEALWAQYWAERPKPTAYPLGPITAVADKPPPTAAPTPTGTTTVRRVPKVGTTIQRSTTTNARKIQALMETPPPPQRRAVNAVRMANRPPATRETKVRQTLTDLFGGTLSDLSDDDSTPDAPPPPAKTEYAAPEVEEQFGKNVAPTNTRPKNPPPVTIAVGDLKISVPFYAIHTSRRYKARIGHRQIILRFNRAGKLRSHREM